MAIVWRKQMSVGNRLIDDDHRYLMCLVNTVELALRTKENHDILAMALDQLVEYTNDHFSREERIQFKIKFPRFVEHKQEHQRIMNDVRTIKAQLDRTLASEQREETLANVEGKEITDDELNQLLRDPANTTEDLDPAQLIALLRHWVLNHILVHDLAMKPFLEKYPLSYV